MRVSSGRLTFHCIRSAMIGTTAAATLRWPCEDQCVSIAQSDLGGLEEASVPSVVPSVVPSGQLVAGRSLGSDKPAETTLRDHTQMDSDVKESASPDRGEGQVECIELCMCFSAIESTYIQ